MRYLFVLQLTLLLCTGVRAQELDNQLPSSYRGIWFRLGHSYPYGDKYSGGLGTYTAKHMPLAVYAAAVDKTYFVYSGTPADGERHLLTMIGSYDHASGGLSRPTVVFDKDTVDDPHDNPALSIDDEGYLWVFVSGRSRKRPGIKLRSRRPYAIDGFEVVAEEEFTYPQIWRTGTGFFHFFTKYTGRRELYFETSTDGREWTADRKLAGIVEEGATRAGHYQVSGVHAGGSVIGTFFNRHRDGHPDTRTDLYYVQSTDLGDTWTTAAGDTLTLPLDTVASPARVVDFAGLGKNVYMKDMRYDSAGRPVCLYLTSLGHEPGPDNAPYEWRVTRWTGDRWVTRTICTSDHNYDMGSLFLDGDRWRIVAPTAPGAFPFAQGGDIEVWESENGGDSWTKTGDVTGSRLFNNGYVRRVIDGRAPFEFFWADGHPHEVSGSRLYFGGFGGEGVMME